MSWHVRVDRRVVVTGLGAVAAAGAGAVLAGCDSRTKSAPGAATRSATTRAPASPTGSAADPVLRRRAVADERRLLAACAAPARLEPFATLSAVHAEHVRVLTGIRPQPPSAPRAPAAAALAMLTRLTRLERDAAAARRTDCVRASADLAPLLVSLAASGNVAVSLLTG